MEQKPTQEKRFASASLPWLVGIAALITYLGTLNHWLSLAGISIAAKASGWTWAPEVTQPLYYLVTLPFRFLPATVVPIALNAFTALCAALTVGQLVRSVALLPQDRTDEQRQREKSPSATLSIRLAWIPPLLAGLICGLQLTFWEHATAVSSEMFDLLLFAYVIRNLLEYRVTGRESILPKVAMVFGAGMANNWAMVGFFPAFIVALVWIKGLSFFRTKFLLRMFLFGLLGVSLYLLLPLLNAFSSDSITFWQALKFNLGSQKTVLATFLRQPELRSVFFLLSLTSLLPAFIISIRWASYFGDSSPLGVALATWMSHLVYGVFLISCIWVMFDPAFSPRVMGRGLPLLTFYYLAALSAGYLCGYFLLVFTPSPNRFKATPFLQGWLNTMVRFGIWLLLLLVPAGLIYKNLPQIQFTNGPLLKQFASMLAEKLPKRSVILSDDAARLFLVDAWLEQNDRAKDYICLDTHSLRFPLYQKFLRKKYGAAAWPYSEGITMDRVVEDWVLINTMQKISDKTPVYYLHPSFGYYFEYFYFKPHGMIGELKPYPPDAITGPVAGEYEISENETFWKKANGGILEVMSRVITPPRRSAKPAFRQRFTERLLISFERNQTAAILGVFSSKSLNAWGVEMQKAGKLEAAGGHFDRAMELNPGNIVAEINSEYNNNLRVGKHVPVQLSQSLEDRFGKYRGWEPVISEYGPFDEPNFCLQQGRVFWQGGNHRQAAQQFERVKTLNPENILVRLWLTQLYVASRFPDKALSLINELRSMPEARLAGITDMSVLPLEASAFFEKNEPQKARQLLRDGIEKNPTNSAFLNAIVQVGTMFGDYTNALLAVDKQLKMTPENSGILVNKGFLLIQVGAYDQAIAPLSYVLAKETNNYPALLDRAIAYLRSEKFDEAQRDYEMLQKAFPKQFQVYYGLGEIAYRKKDTNAAIRSYELYMSNSVPGSAETTFVSERLKSLKAGSH